MPYRPAEPLTSSAVLRHLGVMVAVSVALGVLVAGLALPFAGVLGMSSKNTAEAMTNLPTVLNTEPLAQRTRVLGANGAVIATFYDQNRVNVPLSRVAPIMRKAILATEDSRFYEHGALDLKGTLRAFLTNQASNSTQGGSSITQQLAKMTLVNQAKTKAERKAATEETYQRKIQELRYAIGLEQQNSKDWILERYLNIAYFGDGAYGIQSAAQHYFSVDAANLTPAQASVLAGLVKNPVGYDPTRFPERSLARRDVVLQRMVSVGAITNAQADAIGKTKLGLKVRPATNGCLGSPAAFFCDYVRRYLLSDPALGKTEADRNELLNNGGLTIKTTLDLRFQTEADNATRDAVDATDNAIGALAMVEPGTGNVRAISQSRPMGRDKDKGQTFLNYVVDSKYGDSNGFQAGSTFKIFVLAAALEQGMSSGTTIKSPHSVSLRKNSFRDCSGNYSDYGYWTPRNSTKDGTFNMYAGTQLSVNTFFAQLEQRTGLCDPYRLAQEMGVDLSDPARERVPAFTLGVADVSPLEMAGAYATVAARGMHCQNRPVTEILNRDNKVFKAFPPVCKRVLNEETADTIADILRGVMRGGGFGAALALDKPSAGKTGTTQNNVSVWFDGFTPKISTAAMIAGANREGTPITLNGQRVGGSYIGTAHGSTVAGPMWRDAMRGIQDLIEYADFVRPSYIPPIRVASPKSAAKPKPAAPKPAPKPGKPGKPGR